MCFPPYMSFELNSCGVFSLKDWYTVFHNPLINHTKVIRCAQEAVYPFQSYVFLNYFISLLLMLIIRGVIASVILKQKMHIKLKQYVVNKSLYQYPILAAIHCVASGLLYYGYPYITVFVAIISLLVYCVRKNVLTIFSIANKDHMLFICCHLLAMLYTLSSIASRFIDGSWWLLLLAPLPIIMLVSTEPFSRPDKIDEERVTS